MIGQMIWLSSWLNSFWMILKIVALGAFWRFNLEVISRFFSRLTLCPLPPPWKIIGVQKWNKGGGLSYSWTKTITSFHGSLYLTEVHIWKGLRFRLSEAMWLLLVLSPACKHTNEISYFTQSKISFMSNVIALYAREGGGGRGFKHYFIFLFIFLRRRQTSSGYIPHRKMWKAKF